MYFAFPIFKLPNGNPTRSKRGKTSKLQAFKPHVSTILVIPEKIIKEEVESSDSENDETSMEGTRSPEPRDPLFASPKMEVCNFPDEAEFLEGEGSVWSSPEREAEIGHKHTILSTPSAHYMRSLKPREWKRSISNAREYLEFLYGDYDKASSKFKNSVHLCNFFPENVQAKPFFLN
jgi:hypothetical protein